MKQLISFVLATSLLLTGCISKLEEPVAFTQENSVQANPEGRNFHVRIPSGTKLVLTEENEAAKLYRVSNASTGMTYAFVEETPMSVEQAISLLGNLDEVTLLDKQAVELNGYTGQKVYAELDHKRGQRVPYYFLHAGNRTYVFSLAGGQPWEYFDAFAQSLVLSNE